jgi:hypothetical protein
MREKEPCHETIYYQEIDGNDSRPFILRKITILLRNYDEID